MLTVPTAPQNEAVQALRRAQLQYVQRSEDLRARSQGSPEDPAPQASPGPSKQQERRRRSREEAQAKVGFPQHLTPPIHTLCPLPHTPPTPRFPQAQEAEALYQACVREANARQQDLETTKQRIVSHVRKLVLQGDEVLRRVRPLFLSTLLSPFGQPAKYPSPLILCTPWDARTLHFLPQPKP